MAVEEKAEWGAVADRVRPSVHLEPSERETYWRIDHGADVAVVTTSGKGLARRLLRHPHFDVARIFIVRADGGTGVRDAPHVGPDESVWRVEGELPIGCLKVSAAPRASGAHYEIVSDRVLDAAGGGDG